MDYLIGVIFALFGLVLFERSKRKELERTTQNEVVKQKIKEIDSTLASNQKDLATQEVERERIKNEKESPSLQEIADFINRNRK
jgi:hypothetical protein